MKKQLEKPDYVVSFAALAAFAGMVIYIITSVTGYLASASMNPLPVLGTVVSVILMLAVVFARHRMPAAAADVCMLLSAALVLYSFYQFVLARVALAADVYFIPVNYPASEATALHISIAGVALYLLADLAMILAAFLKRAHER